MYIQQGILYLAYLAVTMSTIWEIKEILTCKNVKYRFLLGRKLTKIIILCKTRIRTCYIL